MRPEQDPTPQADDGEGGLFARLPRYGSYANEVERFVCQQCGVASRYARVYTLPTLVFLFVFFVVRDETVMKCPRCMRRHILLRLPLAILLANVASPSIVIWWLIVFARIFFHRLG